MGYTADATGYPTFAPTPTQTVTDLQAGVAYAQTVGGLLKLTAAQRTALTSGQVTAGWLISETDTGKVYQVTAANPQGKVIASTGAPPPTRGRVNTATSSDGTVTVTHGMGATPSHVFVTDRGGGTRATSRKVLVNARTTTQIQFLVTVTDLVESSGTYSLVTNNFGSNNVDFDWIAFP